MASKKHRPEEAVTKPRHVDVLVSQVRHGMAYADPGASYYGERYKRRVLVDLRRRAKSLGYVLQVTGSTPPAADVEIQVNAMEGTWSLLRSWLRPHLGASQACSTAASLPLYLGFFAFVHNAQRRGKALLATLVA